MRHLLMLLLLVSPSFALAGLVPVREGEVSYEKGTSAEKIQGAIKKAFVGRGWRLRETEAHHILARLELRGHVADVKATWGEGIIHLTYVNSENLKFTEKKGEKLIHRNYNNWIINLERDIAAFLIE